MLSRFRSHVQSNAVAYLALCVALSGTSYAAINLPRNSVGAAQLKANSVSSQEVKNRSLRAGDFARGQLPAGERGPQGPPGAGGAPGAPGAPGSDAQFNGAAAGGDLTGTYPNPTVGPDAIGPAEIVNNSLGTLEIDEPSLQVVKGLGTRVTGRQDVAAGGAAEEVFELPGNARVEVSCGGTAASPALTVTLVPLDDSDTGFVAVKHQNNAVTHEGGELDSPALGTLPPPRAFTFAASSAVNAPSALHVQLVRFGTPRLTTIDVSGVTNFSGPGPPSDCRAFGEAIG